MSQCPSPLSAPTHLLSAQYQTCTHYFCLSAKEPTTYQSYAVPWSWTTPSVSDVGAPVPLGGMDVNTLALPQQSAIRHSDNGAKRIMGLDNVGARYLRRVLQHRAFKSTLRADEQRADLRTLPWMPDREHQLDVDNATFLVDATLSQGWGLLLPAHRR